MRPSTDTALRFARLLGIRPEEAERRRAFLKLGAEDAALLASARALLQPVLPLIVDDLLAVLSSSGEAAPALRDPAAVAETRAALTRYLDTLTGGEYGWVYVQDRLRLGLTLQRAGLPMSLPILAYGRCAPELLAHLARLLGDDPVRLAATARALTRVLSYDLGLVLETYSFAREQVIDTLRRQAEQVVASLPGGILVLRRDLTIITVNRSFLESYQLRSEDVLGRRFEEVVAGCDLAAQAGAVVATGVPRKDVPARAQVGGVPAPRSLRVALIPLRDAPVDKQEAAVLLVLEDVTQEKRDAESLRTKTELLEALTEALTASIQGAGWSRSAQLLLREAVRVTASGLGFLGAVADGPALRLLAWIEAGPGPAVEEAAVAEGTAECPGFRGLDLRKLDPLLGGVIASGKAVVARDLVPDPARAGLPPGFPPLGHFLGVPLLSGSEVVGLIAVANAPAGYGPAELAALELLAPTAGVLHDRQRRAEREENLERQLRQAQKMESLGLLAGGVAHDFNNSLSAIIGFSQLMLQKLDPADRLHGWAKAIHGAGQSAAALTRQLLAFSRKQVLKLESLDLNEVLAGSEMLLRRTIGEHIELVLTLGCDLGRVMADQGQLEQVIMNLVINARDAMPRGGRLQIDVANFDLDPLLAAGRVGVVPGPYVMLTVSDTGCGMDAATQARLFEPFFTTKEPGMGTGLGLAMVFGFIKQSGGEIWVHSEVGRGTTFRIALPRTGRDTAGAAGAEGRAAPLAAALAPARGTETVLVVDDAEPVRALVAEVLRGLGYTVLAAPHPDAALCLAKDYAGPIQLLITDVVMPGMDGAALAARLVEQRPGLLVMYMSGYSDPALVEKDLEREGVHFLQKPVSTRTLVETVRRVLDQAAARPARARD